MKIILNVALMLFCIFPLFAQEEKAAIEKKKYTTQSIGTETPPLLDGLLDDAIWNRVAWEGDFIQRQPNEGEAPSQQTQFKILYDARYIYVGVRCFDTEPEKIVQRLSRRDGFQGDWVDVSFDSYYDLQTAFSFNVTAAGVKGDEMHTTSGSDSSWNPIWYVKTNIDEKGWTAEMKIPLSQLRFATSNDQVWGLQIVRKLFREEERSTWQRIPLDAGGWINNYGKLDGLINVKPKRQIEIQPYTVAKVENYEKEEGNPFRQGNDVGITGGIDGKIGLSNALTLDFTINPDFGQVEADPAAIALDGFQIFFNEQRPFFVENKNIFDYGVSRSAAQNTFGNDNLFYSRRIGKNPSHYPSTSNNEYVDIPDNTTILGAAKISGKTKDGWSIGLLETVTAKEYALIDNEGLEREELVEPLTNYFVGRLKKDFNNRNSNIGGIITSTNRQLEGSLDFLHKSALTGGLDFEHRWNERAWYVSGVGVFSHVKGSAESITNTQRSIGHLYQRTDADHLEVDETATSLTGSGGNVKIGKVGNGDFMFESGVAWRTPGLELNDIGFQRQSDNIRHFTWAGYRWRTPFSIFRFAGVNYNHWVSYDFSGKYNYTGFNVNGFVTFKNNWNAGTGTNLTPFLISNTELRGGPRYRYVPQAGGWFWFESDGRKKLQFGMHVSGDRANDNARKYIYTSTWLSYRPINALSVSLSSNFNVGKNQLQYVTEASNDGDPKYIMATIDQKTLGLAIRINYTINPNLTLQYYGQPFIARGNYTDFKYITDPLAKKLSSKYHAFSSDQIATNEDQSYFDIDEDLDGSIDYGFNNPDFSYVQFRSNLVLRWEYIPGSELFLVWSQGTTGLEDPKDSLFKSLDNRILDNKMENIFLLKATYRLVL